MLTLPSATPSILNVDDNPAGLYAVTRVLRNAGFKVIEAATGAEALAHLAAVPKPDLVILDVNLPDISGLEVCRQIKRQAATTLVIHVSATAIDLSDRVAGLQGGADSYLVHPIEPLELLATINALLRLQQAERRVKQAAHEWSATFDGIQEAVAFLDADGRVTRCNLSLVRLLGQPEEHLLGRSLDQLIPELPALPSGSPVAQVLHEAQHVTRDVRLGKRWFQLSANPVVDESGAPHGLVCLLADVTERKQTELSQALLAQAGTLLAGTLDVQARIERLADLVVPHLADWCSLHMVREDGLAYAEVIRHANPDKRYIAQAMLARYPATRDWPKAVPIVLRTGESMLIPNLTDEVLLANARDDEQRELMRGLGACSVLVVPLVARGQTLGVLALLAAESGRRFGPPELALAEELARRAALAVDNARLYGAERQLRSHLEDRVQERTAALESANRDLKNEIVEHKRTEAALEQSREQLRGLSARLQAVREEERTRLAREVHDELGGALTGLKMDLAALRRCVASEDPEVAKRFEALALLIDGTVRLVRRIATDLRPGLLDDFGLAAAIEWQLGEFEKRAGVKCALQAGVEVPDLDPATATAIFRVFQETLTNVARHAQATRVDVTLDEDEGQLRLEVRDDGRGISPEEAEGGESLGLMGMRERVHLLGGKLEISGAPGKGTRLVVRVPIKR